MRSLSSLANLVIVSIYGWMAVTGAYVATASPTESPSTPQVFRAGAATVDITPLSERSNVAGGFLEAQASKIHDRLFVRCIVLDDGTTTICLTVVDTCMMTQSLIDAAKLLASRQSGISVSNMMVSATHTHSAPAAMACLGTRLDKAYADWLPAKIAECIVAAHAKREPARIGWNSINDWEHTHNRRWIRKPEKKIVDPFGNASGLAHMHPGYLSPDVIGPSGPVDPELFVISVQSTAGRPLAVFANYSQHYFGSQAISSDYYGLFCKYIAESMGESGEGNGPFVCAMSQGTSGDLMWMDYGVPTKTMSMADYAESVAQYAEQSLNALTHRDFASLGIVERTLSLNYRAPDAKRLEWARPIAAAIENDLPKNLQEVYAQEAMILHERQSTSVKLQAIQIGDVTIATLPNEVYALTGLKLKGRSPSPWHFNIELANGAEGYIPPPEQHTLGGYTTWPARTAGLESEAEPKIVESLLQALEEVTQRTRRSMDDMHGPYAQGILDAKPISYWRLEDADGNSARNAIAGGLPAKLSPGYAWYLPGVSSGTGIGSSEELTYSSFSGPDQINRALHLAGGVLSCELPQGFDNYSITFWFWLGERSGASERQGTFCVGPAGETLVAKQFNDHTVQLELNGVSRPERLTADHWHIATLIREKGTVNLWVDGGAEPFLRSTASVVSKNGKLQFGQGMQGKIDEIAFFNRPLPGEEIRSFWNLSAVDRQKQVDVVKQKRFEERGQTVSSSEPLSPERSISKIHVPDGFRVELVACEPQVIDPVAFDWDAKGRLWVIEMSDYPMGMDGQGKSGGRVRILEDRDRDGRYESSSLFADGLNFPNGLLTWRDGVLVAAAPQILFLRDTDGDGKADSKEVLLEGFNEGNQQLRMNGLRWGLDNWVYCANGGHHPNHGLQTKVKSNRNGLSYAIGSRDFRIQPDTGDLIIESGPSQFGRNRDAWGHWFGTQNAKPLWNYVLADRYLARNPYVPAASAIQFVLRPNSPPVYPASRPEKRFHSFKESGHFTSACGGMIFGDSRLFGPSENMHAFTCEPFHNLVQHNVLSDSGVSFTAERPTGEGRFDFFASEDRWCRPVMARTGPDGALWIADMYRYMIEHPDWLPPEGKEELLPHYRLGDDRGRIYRVVPVERPATAAPWELLSGDTASLVMALESRNDWQRDKAQQMLVWLNDVAAIPMLERLAGSSKSPQTRVQAYATLDGMRRLSNSMAIAALGDEHQRVRENAVRMAEESKDVSVQTAAIRLVNDPDEKVCLQLAFTLGQWPGTASGEALVSLAKRFYSEPMFRSAIMSSALEHASTFAIGIAQCESTVVQLFREPIVRQSVGLKDTKVLNVLLDDALTVGNDRTHKLDELLWTLQRVGVSFNDFIANDTDQKLLSSLKQLERVLVQMAGDAKNDRLGWEDRIAAAKPLCRTKENREQGLLILSEGLKPSVAIESQQQILSVFLQSGHDDVLKYIASAWPALSPKLRSQAIDVWMSRANWARNLLDQIEIGVVQANGFEFGQRDRLLRYPEPTISARAIMLFQSNSLFQSNGTAKRQEIIVAYRKAFDLRGDINKGRAVFVRACASCHRKDNLGIEVGPSMATVVEHSNEKLLVNILDPNADIQPGFQAYNVLLDSGEVLTGLLASETANSVSIKSAKGITQTVSRLEIEQLRNSNMSLMPEGLEAILTQQDLADVIAFIRQPSSEAR